MWSSESWSSAADLYLLGRTREGSAEAFGELWRRHLPAAYAVAHRHRGRAAPEDIVAEAATRVFALIRDGRGPDEHFRAYFLTTVRTVAVDMARRDLKAVPTQDGDLESLAEPVADIGAGGELSADLGGDEGVDLVREAFRGLPERDQRVLWHTTVEGAAPRVVAPALGMTANAVSVRAMRARDSLRARYLDVRAERGLPDADSDECRWTIEHLGALVRGRLPKRQTERAQAHVESCAHAAAIAADLRAVHDEFPSLVVPLLVAVGVSTPGFVSAGALAGLTSAAGAGAGAAGAGAAGAGMAGGSAAGATKTAGAAAATGGAAAGGASGGAAAGGTASSGAGGAGAAATTGATADRLGQAASRVTTLAAGIAIGIGLASVTGAPSSNPTPTASAHTPTSTAQAAASPSGTPTAAATVVVPSATASPSANAAEAARSRAPRLQPRPPSPTAAPPVRPTPTPTRPAASPTPSASPTAAGPAPAVEARLVSSGKLSRFSLRVRSAVPGDLTVRVSNASGSGALVAGNASWTCATAAAWSITCRGQSGQVLLEQSGAGRIAPVLVRVTDASGATFTRLVTPS
jgi:RNA polymerase sigma factor (sigma-70 family)